MRPLLKAISGIVLGLAGPLGFGTSFAMTTGPYARDALRPKNPLTTDRDQDSNYMSRLDAARTHDP